MLDLYSSLQRWVFSQKSLFLAKIYVSTGSTWPYFQFIVQDHLYTPFHFKFCTWSVIINPRLEIIIFLISGWKYQCMWWWTHKKYVNWYFSVQTERQRLHWANNFHFRAILSANLIYWTRARGGHLFKVKVSERARWDEEGENTFKVRPAPRIFALLKLPWGMRGLETKTYQMTQKNSIFEERNTRFRK